MKQTEGQNTLSFDQNTHVAMEPPDDLGDSNLEEVIDA